MVKPPKKVAPTSTLSAPKPFEEAPKSKRVSAPILQPDRVPTQQMAGRLELVLGNILKDIKQNYEDKKEFSRAFNGPLAKRKMKQAIRERLRAVMLNKPVGAVSTIMDIYRAAHPEDTDIEIVKIAMENTSDFDDDQKARIKGSGTKHFVMSLSKVFTTWKRC